MASTGSTLLRVSRTLLFAALATLPVWPAAHAQAPADVMQLVKDASWNELHAHGNGHTFRYRQHTVDSGKETTKEIVETSKGDISRLLGSGGQPLSPAANQKELARLDKLLADPEIQASKHKKEQEDSDRQNEMVRLLPSAFTYTDLGMVDGPNGPCYRLRFEPNPAFNPPDRQAQVYHGMAGELWIDKAQKRMVRFDAHLISDVDFGWGIAGRLNKGGTIQVQQRDAGDGHWETTYLRLNLTGKILLLKNLTIDSTENDSNFEAVSNDGYKAAIALLKTLPLGQS